MPMMISGAMALGGGVLSSFLGSQAAKKQIQTMREALDFAKGVDARTYADLSPYRDFGKNQLNALSDFVGTKNPNDYIDPGYDFRLKSGVNAIGNNAAASGLVQSGDTLRALTQYGQDMGSQEYGNAFNRYLGEGQFRQGLAGMGQNAATMAGQLGNQTAGNVGNISANMNAGGELLPWADLAGGVSGMGMNAFAKRMNLPGQTPKTNGGGSNIFANDAMVG